MVVRGGRGYLRRILDLMKPLHASHHKIVVPETMKEDLRWWRAFLSTFHGKTWLHPTSQWVNVYVDASLTGGGRLWGKDWAYTHWESETPEANKAHINVKEIMSIGLAVRRWVPRWRNASVVIHMDNITAKAAVNKGTTQSNTGMTVVREIFWLSTLYNFKIKAVHIPGKLNVFADAISRLHSASSYPAFQRFLNMYDKLQFDAWNFYLLLHMSFLKNTMPS